ncbi:MAG: NAD-dependent epimerase/dehydratase family protein, partial [Planctomycetota bacterium]
MASTGGAIIGDCEPPVHEDMVPRPVSPYGASKLAAEGYCSAFAGSYNMNTVALRFANVYGPYSYHKGSVIAKFFKNILHDEPLTVYGDGTQTRDFVYTGDLCQAIQKVIFAEHL